MTFVHPEALLLFLPAVATAAWIMFWRGPASFRLPGHWHRVIEAPMQPFMARQVASRSRMPWAFWLAVWSLMVLGLARPILESGAPAPYGNLAGRVIAIDLGADTDLEQQKLLVYRILDAAPTTPTALVLRPPRRSTSCRSRRIAGTSTGISRSRGPPSCPCPAGRRGSR